MNIMTRALAIAILVILFVTEPLRAVDVVRRKSTRTPAQGTITSTSRTDVVVTPRNGPPITIGVNDVDRIRWDGEPPALNLARSAEDAGHWQEALDGYLKGAQEANSNSNLKQDLEFLIGRTTAKMAVADPSDSARLDDAIARLEAFRRDHPDSFRYYDATLELGRAYVAKGDDLRAQTAFAEVERAPWADYQMAAQIEQAGILSKQGEYRRALAAFQKVASASEEHAQVAPYRQQALLGKIACLTQLKDYDAALKALDEVIQHASPTDQHLQASAYVLQGNCFQALGRNQDAVLAYLHVDLLFPGETAARAEALFHLSRLWSAIGQPSRAADASARLASEYPQSSWAKKLRGG